METPNHNTGNTFFSKASSVKGAVERMTSHLPPTTSKIVLGLAIAGAAYFLLKRPVLATGVLSFIGSKFGMNPSA
jgi:hypothetical protein